MASSHSLLVSCLLALVMAMANATQYKVGGSAGWAVPANPTAMPLNQWAERNRFQIGDSLLFVYPADKDSVLQVTQDAYTACDTSSPIKRFNDGNTVFTLDKSGPYYFISGGGGNDNCRRNEKMVVVVMADRSNRSSNATKPAVSPATAPATPPAQSTSPPSPPPPPPAEVPPPAPATPEVTPAPAPTGEESRPPPPPNSATLKAVGVMSSVGALFGSLVFAF